MTASRCRYLSICPALALVLVGCGSGLRMRVPDAEIQPRRTVVLPVWAVGYELDYDNNHLDEAERSRAMERTIGVELERLARTKGARPVPFDKVTACGVQCTSLLSTVVRWGRTATSEIAAERDGIASSGRTSVGQWRNRRDFGLLQRAIDADFALVGYLRDVHETSGRKLAFAMMNSIGQAMHNRGEPLEAHRVVAACVLELRSGRMVWCASVSRWSMHDAYLDIKAPAEARRLVKELLAEF